SLYALDAPRLSPAAHGASLEPSQAAAVPIYRRADTGEGALLEAVAVRHGQGKALFFADPSLFANRALGRADNAPLLASTAPHHPARGATAFEESPPGSAAGGGIAAYVGRPPLGPAIRRAPAALAALAPPLGGRRGRPPILDDERPPESR